MIALNSALDQADADTGVRVDVIVGDVDNFCAIAP